MKLFNENFRAVYVTTPEMTKRLPRCGFIPLVMCFSGRCVIIRFGRKDGTPKTPSGRDWWVDYGWIGCEKVSIRVKIDEIVSVPSKWDLRGGMWVICVQDVAYLCIPKCLPGFCSEDVLRFYQRRLILVCGNNGKGRCENDLGGWKIDILCVSKFVCEVGWNRSTFRGFRDEKFPVNCKNLENWLL